MAIYDPVVVVTRTAHPGDNRWMAKFWLERWGDEDSRLYARCWKHGPTPEAAFNALLESLGGKIPETEEELVS